MTLTGPRGPVHGVRSDRLLARGKHAPAVCRELGVSQATYRRWRNQFGGLKTQDAERLKGFEREKSTLKRLSADAELEKVALKEIARGSFKPRNAGGEGWLVNHKKMPRLWRED
ncbi:transposase [Mycobacterium shigaense]|uniref:Transposase n=1 Tax=Mycobacterium shigaense TaxID=722731 RepID=A0A1Z4EBB8_9MYCO|nr:transposase [Mycobacterium shigaense]